MSNATAALLAIACFLSAAIAAAALVGVLLHARRTARVAAVARDDVRRSGGATAWIPGPRPSASDVRDEPARTITTSTHTSERE